MLSLFVFSFFFFFSSRRRHTRSTRDWSSDVCSSDLVMAVGKGKILENGKVRPMDLRAGDRVLFGKYSGTEVKVAGEELIVAREEDIMAVIDEPSAERQN